MVNKFLLLSLTIFSLSASFLTSCTESSNSFDSEKTSYTESSNAFDSEKNLYRFNDLDNNEYSINTLLITKSAYYADINNNDNTEPYGTLEIFYEYDGQESYYDGSIRFEQENFSDDTWESLCSFIIGNDFANQN